jgi:hypothetical protein
MKITPLKQTIGQIMHTIEFDTHTEQALSRLAAIAERYGLTVCTLDRGMTAAALALGLHCETL